MNPTVGDTAPDVGLVDADNQPTRLATLWQQQPLVLLFLRHLGCPFCRELVADVRDQYPEFHRSGAEVAAVTMGTAQQAAQFRAGLKLPFPCLADPAREAYQAFGVPRGGVTQIVGPAVWAAGLKAALRGGAGIPIGDPLQLQGIFIIDRRGVVRYAYRATNSADRPSAAELLDALAALPGDA